MKISPSSSDGTLKRFWVRWKLQHKERAAERSRQTPKARYQHLMETANAISAINPSGLHDLIKAILRPLQAEHLLSVAEFGREANICVDWQAFFGEAVRHAMFDTIGQLRGAELPADEYTVSLASDIVLPWPWHHGRYVSAIAMIGQAKGMPARPEEYPRTRWMGPWRYDEQNHRVTLWLPWRIGFVGGGNHSIAAGILSGEGVLAATEVYDMGFLFEELCTDGINFYCRKSGRLLGRSPNPRIAAVFEIGRLIQKHATRESAMKRES